MRIDKHCIQPGALVNICASLFGGMASDTPYPGMIVSSTSPGPGPMAIRVKVLNGQPGYITFSSAPQGERHLAQLRLRPVGDLTLEYMDPIAAYVDYLYIRYRIRDKTPVLNVAGFVRFAINHAAGLPLGAYTFKFPVYE